MLAGHILNGSNGRSLLDGGAGDDRLMVFGGTGNRLDGGAGADRLIAGDGDDVMIGGADADRFIFDLRVNQGDDVIEDLDRGIDQLKFFGVGSRAALDAVSTVTDAGPGGDVTIAFNSGATLTVRGAGTGAIDSIADLLADPVDQLLF